MGLSHPVTSRVQERNGDNSLHMATSSMCGFRRSMEDAHSIVLRLPNHPNTCFVGVFDGHGGKLAARFCADHLAQRVDQLEKFTDENLKRVVMELDAEFCRPENAEREHGTTCVFVLIVFNDQEGAPNTADDPRRPIDVIVCNTGDSRILWGGPDGAAALTEDHKPTLDEERLRIENAGGHVAGARVDGDLALSRAVGDWKYKCNPELPAEQQKVIALPDITRRTVHSGDYLLVACDGIFERLENDDVLTLIKQSLEESPDPMKTVESILFRSLEAGSKDNMTACLVMLTPNPDYVSKPEMLFGPIHPQEKSFMSTYTQFAEESGFGDECAAFISKWHEEHGTTPAQFNEDEAPVEEAFIRQLLWSRNPLFLSNGPEDQQEQGDVDDLEAPKDATDEDAAAAPSTDATPSNEEISIQPSE